MHKGSAPPDHIPRCCRSCGGRPLLTWLRALRLAFDGVLDPAHRVLHLALGLVQLAFALQLRVPGELACPFLDLAASVRSGTLRAILVHGGLLTPEYVSGGTDAGGRGFGLALTQVKKSSATLELQSIRSVHHRAETAAGVRPPQTGQMAEVSFAQW